MWVAPRPGEKLMPNRLLFMKLSRNAVFGVLLFFKYIPQIAIHEVKAFNKYQLKEKEK